MSRSVTLKELCNGVEFKNGSRKQKEVEAFIAAHQRPAPVEVVFTITRGPKSTKYKI